MKQALFLSLVLVACGSTPPSAPAVDGPVGTTDGPAQPDGPPVAADDPAGDGSFSVSETTGTIPGALAGRQLPSTIYTPAGVTDAPFVIVSPGFQMDREQYASYARHLATWGFVVALTDYAETGFSIDHQRLANDVSAVIDHAIEALPIDAAKIAAVGHSLGGKISIFAASQDPRIRAVVGWDPVDSNNPSVAPQKMTAMTAAIAVVGETTNAAGGGMPCAPAAENFTQFYAAAPSPAMSITVAGADHMDWVDDPTCFFCGFCAAGAANAELARTVSRRVDVAWLRLHLLGDTAMEPWLASPPELGMLTIARR